MEVYMREWLQYLNDPSVRPGHNFRTHLVTITASRTSFVMSAVLMCISTMDALCAHSSREALVYARFILGTYSGMAAMTTLRRRDLLIDCVRKLVEVAAMVESRLDPYPLLKVRTQVRVERARRQVMFYTCYGTTIMVGTILTMLIETQRWADVVSLWLSFQDEFDESHQTAVLWAHSVTKILLMSAVPFIVNSLLMVILPTLLVLYGCMAHLQSQINFLIEVSPCTPGLARMHSDLMFSAMAFNRTVERYVPHYLVSAFVLPLLSTVDVVMNGRNADGYALVVAPVVFIVFIPMCEAGDEMAAAHEGLASCAYNGPWLEEGRDQAHLRACLMLASRSRGAFFRGRGIGVLDRGACRQFIRGWFSFLQALINLRRGRPTL